MNLLLHHTPTKAHLVTNIFHRSLCQHDSHTLHMRQHTANNSQSSLTHNVTVCREIKALHSRYLLSIWFQWIGRIVRKSSVVSPHNTTDDLQFYQFIPRIWLGVGCLQIYLHYEEWTIRNKFSYVSNLEILFVYPAVTLKIIFIYQSTTIYKRNMI